MRSSALWSLLALLALAVVSYAVYSGTRPPGLPDGFLYGNGHIEGTEIRIASEVAGRVLEQHLTEGERVEVDAPLVVIDPQMSRDQLESVRGELAVQLEMRAGLESQIATWTHHAETARRHVSRVRSMLESRVASPRDLDEAENGLQEALGQLESLKAERQALDGRIASVEAKLRLAESRLEKTEVLAPTGGTVLVRAVEAGEVVQPGQPLGLLVDLERLELKVYIPGRDLGLIKLGNAARIRVDAFPERHFESRVIRVDDYAQFTPRDIHVPEERTRMVYGVTLALDNPGRQLKPGMPADAWIRWDESKSWPASLPVPRS